LAEAVGEIGKRGALIVALDQARVGEVTVRLMESLDEQGFGEDAEITDVVLTVAVDHEGGAKTSVHFSSSPGMPTHAKMGLLTYAQSVLLRQ
jgi:hypothetical protein